MLKNAAIPPAETGYAFLLEDILVNNAPVKPQIGVTIFNGLYLDSCEFALDKFFVWAGAFTSFQDRLAAENFGWHVLNVIGGISPHVETSINTPDDGGRFTVIGKNIFDRDSIRGNISILPPPEIGREDDLWFYENVGALNNGERVGAILSGLSGHSSNTPQFFRGQPESDRGESKNNGERRYYCFTMVVENNAKTISVRPDHHRDSGNIFLKILLGCLGLCLVNAVFKRLGSRHHPHR